MGIDDILYLLGFNSKKELIPRLKELKYKRAIFEIEGGRWKKNTDTATMNGANGEPTETFISPACKEDLPSVYLPGSEKFSSYKNTLQELCQKKKDTSANNDASKVAKLMGNGAKDSISFKSRLNEYAQKKQISFAKYETVPVNGGFFSTVYFNG